MPAVDEDYDGRPRLVRRGKHIRAVIYTRVSSDKTGRLRSPKEQEEYCRKECARRDWDIVDVLTDGSMSASEYANKERPNWQKVLGMIKRREVDVLVVWSSSRATRNVVEGIQMLEDMKSSGDDTGVKYSYDGRVYDPDDPNDLHRLRQNVIDDARKSELTAADVRRSLNNNLADGKAHGRIPFGYQRDSEGRQTKHPIEAPLVQKAAALLLGGESCLSVCKWLDEQYPMPQRYTREGNPWGKPGWDQGRLKHMMTNPVYAGKRLYKPIDAKTGKPVKVGKLVDAEWSDDALWNFQQHLDLVALYNAAWRKQFRNTPGRRHHLLSGIAECSVCHSKLYAGVSKGGRRSTYRCGSGHVTVDRDSLDALVSVFLVEGISKEFRKLAIGPTPEQADLVSQIAFVNAQLDEAKSSLSRATKPGAIDVLAELVSEHKAALAQLEVELAEANKRRRVQPTAALDLANSDNPQAAWSRLTVEEQGAVIRDQLSIVVKPATQHLGRAVVFDAGRVDIDWLLLDAGEGAA